jgi:tetratricopeptide (TPR) repeat protein
MRVLPVILLLAIPAGAFAEPAKRHDPEGAQQYTHCINLARTIPDQGWQEALAWSSLGGGEPAQHCAAVAMIGMRQFEDGARKLESLSDNSEESPKLRAGMLAQAGQAWLLAKQPDEAFRVQSKALLLVPGAPDLLVDRAQSQAEQKNYQGALQDLDAAIQAAPNRSDAYIFRAAARRHLEDRVGARADIDQALRIDPESQDALLEDGILKGLAGDEDGARTSWQKVIELSPQSEAADTARRDLELLDGRRG